jgi:HK97 family phage major capsid protein
MDFFNVDQMKSYELRQKRGEIIDQMKALNDRVESKGRDFTSAEQNQFEKMMAQQKTLKERADRMDDVDQIHRDSWAVEKTTGGPTLDGQTRTRTSNRLSIPLGEVNFLRSGDKSGLYNALEIGSDPAGGYTVVPSLADNTARCQPYPDRVQRASPVVHHWRG